MSTRDEVYRLTKELAFWSELNKHDAPDEREFKLERQIRQLSNCDEFGIPRYNGHLDEDDDEDDYYIPKIISCRYCGKMGLKWTQWNGKWRLTESGVLHTCESYKKNKAKG